METDAPFVDKQETTPTGLDRPAPLGRSPAFAAEPGYARNFLGLGGVALALWLSACWLVSGEYTAWRASQALTQSAKEVRQSLDDMTLGIQRSLSVFHGIPAALGRNLAVVNALRRYGDRSEIGGLAPDARKAVLARDSLLTALNRSLAGAVEDVSAISVIWLIDPDGNCIAASNGGTGLSFVGTNYRDRTYFTEAMAGRPGHQFALGRVTNIPGLFFSAPVRDGDRILGVMAVKIDLPYLTSWVNQANAFLSDNYGVVVLAQDKSLEMRTLPGAGVTGLTPAQRVGRYKRSEFETLPIIPWGAPDHPDLYRWEADGIPYVRRSSILPEDDLALTILSPVPEIADRGKDRLSLFSLTGALGALVIVLTGAVTHYWLERERSRRNQANRDHIEYLATHDVLTGLFSRSVLDQFIIHGIAGAKRAGRELAVLFIDLDQFKVINDNLGHEVGDLVLKEAARRLRGTVRGADVVIRQGGDEFIVMLADLPKATDAANVAEKILSVLSEPYTITDPPQSVSASIGIACYPADGETPSLLLRRADMAMYRAKEEGRAACRFYRPAQNGG